MPAPHALYLHGFGSGPSSAKGRMVGDALRDRVASYAVPDLEGGDFYGLTMDGILARARAAHDALPADGRPLLVIGSSLGGYCAAMLCGTGELPRCGAMLLIAPAFGFTERWRELLGHDGIRHWRESGERHFYHFAREEELPLSSRFLDSAERLPALPPEPPVRTVVVHGRRDESVAWRWSLRYAERTPHVDLHLVDGDHALTAPDDEALLGHLACRLATGLAG